MKRTFGFLCLALTLLAPPLFPAQPSAAPKGKGTGKKGTAAAPLPAPTEKQVYKEVEGKSLEIWIWKPANWSAKDKHSAIVFYHGGGWRNGSPNAFARQSAKLAEKGMVAFSVQYRLTSQAGVTIVDCVKDAKSAFRWVRAHANELGIDPAKIAAGGGSAGGHLAAALATLDAINDPKDDNKISTMPAALVLFNPAVRLNFARAQEASNTRTPESVAAVSPYEHVKKGHPPTIIFHGEDDTTVPIQSVRDYGQKVASLDGSCTVVGFDGQVHSFFNREPFVWDTLKQAEAFLKKHQLLE
ncbi:MAG: alpha/beta hydrolase [Opitutaceae bacterium]|nr:alpha/beta hydrolase [Opitutaceae bacterium]